MSREIDEKIVEMRFDNRDFEKNVSTSLSTLDKLKEKLKFHGAEKGFEDLSTAAGRVNFGGMGSAIDTVTAKFDTMQAVAVRVLSNIAESAIKAGADFVKSFTIDPILSGWDRFGEKTKAVGTLVSQGYQEEEVYDLVEKLMWYADETSFSMNQMLKGMNDAIGAGSTLEEAATALMGITGIVAKGGKSGADANHLITQLGQAMGRPMTAQDWMSVSNLGLATNELKQSFLDAGEALGTLVKDEEGYYRSIAPGSELKDSFSLSNFAASLAKGRWLTTDVQMAVYTKYASAVQAVYDRVQETGEIASEAAKNLFDAGLIDEFGYAVFKSAQEARTWRDVMEATAEAVSTGWSTTFEKIFGKYEDATHLFTMLSETLYNVFAESGNIRNAILDDWNLLDGRLDLVAEGLSTEISKDSFIRRLLDGKTMEEQTMIMQNYSGVLQQMLAYADEYGVTMAEAFEEFSDQLDAYGYAQFAAALEMPRGALWNLIDALFAFDEESEQAIGIIEIIKQAYSDIFPPMTGERLKEITTRIREFTASLIPSAEKAEKLRSTFKGLFAILDIGKQVISAVWRTVSPIFQKFGVFSDILLDNTADLGERIAAFAANLRENDTIYKTIQNGLGILQGAFSKIGSFIDPAIKKVQEWWQAALDWLKIPEDATIVTGIITAYQTLREYIETKMIPLLETWWDAAKKYLHLPSKEQFQTWWKTTSKAMSDFFTPAITKLREWGRAFADNMKNIDWEGVKDSFRSLGSSIREHFSGAIDACRQGLEKLREMLPDLKEKFGEFGQNVGKVFSTVWGFVKTNILGENNEGLWNIAKGLIGFGVFDLIKNISGPLKELREGFHSMFGGLGDALSSFGSVMDSWKAKGWAKILMEIAIALGILAIGVAAIATQDPNSIIAAGGAIATLMAELVGALFVGGKASGSLNLSTIGTIIAIGFAFTKLAKAIKIVVDAIIKLEELNSDDIADSVLAIVSIITSIGGALALSKGAVNAKSVGWAFIEIAAAMEIFVDVFKKFGEMNPDQLIKGGAAVAGTIMAIALALRIVSGGALKQSLKGSIFGDKGKADIEKMKLNAVAIGFAFLEIAASLEIVAHVIKTLGEMNWKELLQGGLAMTLALGVIVGALRLVPKNTLAIGTGILEISIALGILAGVIKSLGKLATSEGGGWIIAGGLLAVVGAFGALALGLKMLDAVGADKVLLRLSSAMLIAGLGMAAFGAGILALSTGLIALGTAFAAGGVLSGAGLVALTEGITLAVKAAIKGVLDMLPMIVEGLKETFFAILDFLEEASGEIVETLGVIILNVLEGIEIYGPQIAEVIMRLLNAALDWLNENGGPLLDKIFDFLIMIIDKLTERLPELIDHVITFLTTLFSGVISSLEALDPDILMDTLKGMGIVATLMGVCAGLSTIAIPAMKGLGEAGAFIIELGAIIAAIGALSTIPGAMDLVGKGGDMLGEIGAGIGKFFGGIAGGAIGKFCDEIKDVTPDTLAAADSLASIILKLTAGSIVAGLSVFLGGPIGMAAFGLELEALAPCLKKFAEDMQGVDVDVIKNSAPILEKLMEIGTSAPRYGGIWQAFTGQNSLSIFGAELASFGPHLKEYGKSLVGLSITAINNSMEVIEKLIDIGKNAPRYGGLWQALTGQNSIGILGGELATFGPNLKTYGKSLVGLSITAINNSMEIVEKLIEIGKNAPRYGGLWQAFTGQNSIGVLGAELATFGPHLKTYGDALEDVQVDVINNSMEIVEKLVEVGKNAPRYGGLWQALIGDNSLSILGAQLAKFGPSIKIYGENVENLPVEKIEASLPAITALVDLAKSVSEKVSGFDFLGGAFGAGIEALQMLFGSEDSSFVKTISQLGTALTGFYSNLGTDIDYGKLDQAVNRLPKLIKAVCEASEYELKEDTVPVKLIQSLGEAIAIFYLNVKNIKFDDIDKAIKRLRELAKILDDISSKNYATEAFTTALKTVGKSMINAVISGVEDRAANLYTKVQEVIDEAAKRAEATKKDFKAIGEGFCEKIGKGFEDRKSKLSSDVSLALSGMLSALKLKNTDFYNAGKSMIDDFAKGFQANGDKLGNEVESAVALVLSKIRDMRDEFEDVGKYLMEGLAEGINSQQRTVEQASGGVTRAGIAKAERVGEIASPSKVMMRIGAFMGEGLAIGLENSTSRVMSASDYLATSGINAISDAINAMSTDMATEDLQPVITPVLDLSRIQAQKQLVDAMFGGNRLVGAVAANASMQITAKNQNAESPVVTELRSLRSDMTEMTERMSRLQVVMDSGELVGALSGPMDTALGMAAVKYRRGI